MVVVPYIPKGEINIKTEKPEKGKNDMPLTMTAVTINKPEVLTKSSLIQSNITKERLS